jgi:hypothetical protein
VRQSCPGRSLTLFVSPLRLLALVLSARSHPKQNFSGKLYPGTLVQSPGDEIESDVDGEPWFLNLHKSVGSMLENGLSLSNALGPEGGSDNNANGQARSGKKVRLGSLCLPKSSVLQAVRIFGCFLVLRVVSTHCVLGFWR